jgi:MFS family permease
MQAPETRSHGLHYGWVMVALTPLFIGLADGLLSSTSVFLKPLSADLGWLRGEMAFGYLAGTLAMGVGGIAMGFAADRFPLRRVAMVGAVALGGALLLLSRLHSLIEFYGYYVLLTGLGASAFFAPLVANVGNWFERNKGLAIGVTTAGEAVGEAGVIYGSRLLITWLDWRGAYLALGLIAWGLLLPLSPLIRKPARKSTADPAVGAPPPPAGAAPAVAPALVVGWISAAVIFC